MVVTERTLSKKLTEFEERRKLGRGQFFTRADIDKINPIHVADILRRATAVRVRGVNVGIRAIQLSDADLSRWRCAGPHSPRLPAVAERHRCRRGVCRRIDGAPVAATWSALESIHSCGAILLWTKDGS